MIFQDDRTEDQKKSHLYAVAGTDKFLSGWGGARGGASVAAWACTLDDLPRVEKWVGERRNMKRVRTVTIRDWRPRAAHVHLYVWEKGKPDEQAPTLDPHCHDRNRRNRHSRPGPMNPYPELQPHLDAARLAEERARREGLPDRHWPLAWDIVVNSRSLVPGLSSWVIRSRIVDIARAVLILDAAVFGQCSVCRRPWPQSYHPLECPACKRGHLIPPAWRVNATQP